MTRDEMVGALRAGGYDGPVSYGKARLEELLAGRGSIPVPTGQSVLSGDLGPSRLTEWAGLKAGDRVKVAERADGSARKGAWWKFGYYTDDGRGGFVHVSGDSKSTGGRVRDVAPHKIQDRRGRFVAPREEEGASELQ